MHPVQRMMEQVGVGFRGLSGSGKLLLAALGAIAILSLFLMDRSAGPQAALLPLGLAAASDDVRAETASYLEGARIPFEERGNDLFVPAEDRLTVLGQLNEQKIVGTDEINFNSLVELGSNPFLSQQQQRQMHLIAKMNAVKSMVAVRRDVGFVDIIIDEKTGLPGIGQARIPPTAIVAIQMRGEPMTQDFADAVGHMVAGAQAGLKLADVTVMDLTAMRHFKPQAAGQSAAGGYLEQQRRIEEHYRSRFEQFFAHVPGAVVTVTAVVRNQRQTTRETRIDDPKIAPKSSETRESHGGRAGVDELDRPQSSPGSNIAASIPGNWGTPSSEVLTREERESRFGGTETVIEDETGYALQVNAVVGVPRSWIVTLFEEEQRNGGVPDSADPALFQAFAESRTDDLESALAPLIRTDPLEGAVPGAINVVMLPDFTAAMLPAMPLPEAGNGAATASPPAATGIAAVKPSLLRHLGLTALAVASLVMIGLVIRHAARRPLDESAARQSSAHPNVSNNGRAAHRVGSHHADDALNRANSLIEQINQLVTRSADDAAQVIDQWLTPNGR